MRNLFTLLAGATLAIWTTACWPQAGGPGFPARPVRMVVAFTPGGGTDIIARIVAQKLGGRWGQPVVVENRAGAGGNIATELVAKGAPDGYTLLMAFSSHASNPALYGKLPFDIDKDFTSLTLVGSAPMVVAASPALPAKTLAELIEYARSHPGAVKFGSSGVGTPVHLAGELMMQLTGIKMVHVPYKGIAPAMTAILAGEIEITYVAVLTGLQHFRAGKLSPLAVAGRSRYPALPEVPTAAEAGLKGYEIDFWYALPGVHRVGRQARGAVRADQERLRALVESDQDGRGKTGVSKYRAHRDGHEGNSKRNLPFFASFASFALAARLTCIR